MSPPGRGVALIVTPRFPPLLGGMERECALLAERFARMGFQPVVLTEDFGQNLPLRETVRGVLVIRIPSSPERRLFVQLRVAVGLARGMIAVRGRASFAIVRTFTLPALVSGLLRRLRLIDYPTLVTAETGGAEDDVVALEKRQGSSLMKWMVSGNDRLNGLCQANVDHMRQFGYPLSRLTTIPNGVETEAWHETSPPTEVRRFLYLGRIDETKGVLELVEALGRLRDHGHSPTLMVAGAGPAEDQMKELVTASGLNGCVSFLGLVPHSEVGDLLSRADCLVLPSWSEGMPLSVLEAATRHRVLVLSDVGDMRRLFGDSAHIFPPGDIDALTDCMAQAMTSESPSTDYEGVITQVSIDEVARRLAQELSPTEAFR